MNLRLFFLLAVAAESARRHSKSPKRQLAPRRPLESDHIKTVEEYEVEDFQMSATGASSHTLTVKFVDHAHLRADGTQAVTSTSGHSCSAQVGSAAASLGAKLIPLLQDVGEELEALARRAEKMSG